MINRAEQVEDMPAGNEEEVTSLHKLSLIVQVQE